MDRLTEFKLRAERNTEHNVQGHLNVVSNIDVAITPPWIARFRSNFLQSLTTTAGILQMVKVKGQGYSVT